MASDMRMPAVLYRIVYMLVIEGMYIGVYADSSSHATYCSYCTYSGVQNSMNNNKRDLYHAARRHILSADERR